MEKRWAEDSSNSARMIGDWSFSKQAETASGREQQENPAKFQRRSSKGPAKIVVKV